MSCDVGEATEGFENELWGKATEGLENELWRRWSDGKVGEWAELTAHSQTLPLLHLRHRSFSNPSFASPTSQALHLNHLASRPWQIHKGAKAGLPESVVSTMSEPPLDNSGQNTKDTPSPRIEIKISDPAGNRTRAAMLKGGDSTGHTTATVKCPYINFIWGNFIRRKAAFLN